MYNNETATVSDWQAVCKTLASEYWEDNSDQDPTRYARECADGSQWAIYPSHAWDLVSAVREIHPRALDQVELYLESHWFSIGSLDKTMTLLAYQLTYNEILTQINEQEESEND